MKKKKLNSVDNLEKKLNDIYSNDAILNSLKQFDEDRKALLQLSSTAPLWQESTMQNKILEMEKAIKNTTLQNAFKSPSDYESYAKPILSSIHDHDYASLEREIKKNTEPWLNNNYIQMLKATDLLNDTITKAKEIGLSNQLDSYASKLSETALEYMTKDKLNTAQSILGLTSAIDTDIFQKEMESINTTKSMSEMAMKDITRTHNKITEPPTIDIPPFEIPKYENTIMGKVDKQVEILERLSSYMIKQNKNLELQNEIATEQSNQLKEQNAIIKNQVKETSKTSWIALGTAVFSILISSYISWHIFKEEDKSDMQNHKEVKDLLQENNKNILMELKEQNKNGLRINEEIKKQNQYFEKFLKSNIQQIEK